MFIFTILLYILAAYLVIGAFIGLVSILQTYLRGEHRLHDTKGMLLFALSCIPLWLLYALIKRDLNKG